MTSYSQHVPLAIASSSSSVPPVSSSQHQLSRKSQQLCGSQSSSQAPCGTETGPQWLLCLPQPPNISSNLMPQPYLPPLASAAAPCTTDTLVLRASSNDPGTLGLAENPGPSRLADASHTTSTVSHSAVSQITSKPQLTSWSTIFTCNLSTLTHIPKGPRNKWASLVFNVFIYISRDATYMEN